MASEAGLSQLTKALEDLAKRNDVQRSPPLRLQGDKASNWRIFKQLLEVSLSSSGRETNEAKTSWLYSSIGEAALRLIDGFDFDDEADKLIYVKLLEKFEEYCVGEANETYERWVFNFMIQGESSFDKFKNDITKQANRCNFSTLKKSLIRDRIVVGVKDQTLRKKTSIYQEVIVTNNNRYV
jgi:hypothetical protein